MAGAPGGLVQWLSGCITAGQKWSNILMTSAIVCVQLCNLAVSALVLVGGYGDVEK